MLNVQACCAVIYCKSLGVEVVVVVGGNPKRPSMLCCDLL